MKRRTPILFILLIAAFILSACGSPANSMTVSEAWARPGIAGGISGVFFTVTNSTGEDEKLLSAESDIALAVEIHKSTMVEGGAMQMMPQEWVEILANSEIKFEPGSLHLMLVELKNDLRAGDSISLSLVFEQAGTITLTVEVQER